MPRLTGTGGQEKLWPSEDPNWKPDTFVGKRLFDEFGPEFFEPGFKLPKHCPECQELDPKHNPTCRKFHV